MGTHPEVGGDEAVRVLLGVLHEDLVARGELRVDRVGRRGDEAATIVPGDPLADRGEELRHLAAIAGREDDATGLQAEVLRPEERRVGQACVSTCRSRWAPDN